MTRKTAGYSAGGRTEEQQKGDVGERGPAYDPTTDTYLTTFSPTETAASIAVVKALTDIRCCSTTDLEPLYDAMDTDALDTLVDSAGSSLEVRFSLDGFGVLVTSTGRIEVTPPE